MDKKIVLTPMHIYLEAVLKSLNALRKEKRYMSVLTVIKIVLHVKC